MRSLRMTLAALRRAIVSVLRDPETRALPFLALAIVALGTVFYWAVEDWNPIEALYFSPP